jgi:putative ABC transport system ATP-binding protein
VLGRELRGAGSRTLTAVRRHLGYIFQSHNLVEALTAVQNVEMAVRLDRGLSRAEVRERAMEMLARVGLEEIAGRHPSQLSGGQRQRVAVARALAGRPSVVLADEPTASLDRDAGREVIGRLEELARAQEASILLVTHDHRILDVGDRILRLEDGKLSSV